MDGVVARCPDCGREHSEEFAQCDWCGRKQPSRWWCAACHDWRARRYCPACAGGLGVPSEVVLGPCVVGTVVEFQFAARNSGKKALTCLIDTTESAVELVNSRFVLLAGQTTTVGGELTVPREPGRRTFRLVAFDGAALSETLLIADAVAAEPRLEFLPALVQLRTANPGSVVRTSVVLKNTGNVPLSANLSAADPWLAVEAKQLALAPGESAEVKLRARTKKTDSGPRETKLVAAADDGSWGATVRCLLPDPELTADPVAFGELAPGRAAFADVIVRNVGRVRVNCTVAAAADWLRVTPARINLHPGREKKVRVRAVLTVEEDGPQSSELLVSSANGVVLRVPVSATGKMPQPVLRAVRRQRLREAIGARAERKFQIETPELRVGPGKKRKLRYVVDLSGLALGEHAATITVESNGGTATVPVTLRVLDPNPVLEVVSGPDLGLLSSAGPLSAVVQVRNAGIGLLRVRAESANPQNIVTPAEIDVPPGPPVRFNLTIPVSGLSGGAYEAAVLLTSNGGAGRAVVRFRLTPEHISAPEQVALGVREAGRPSWDWLRVRNTGQYPVTLHVRAADSGIKLGTDHIALASLETLSIPYYLELPEDVLGPVTGAILLEGRSVRHRVVVRAIARKIELVVEPKVLDLGKLRPGEEREFTATLVNKGEIAAEVYAMSVPGELEVRVWRATVPPGARVALVGSVRANTEETGQRVWTTVKLGYGVTLRCEATVVAPVLPKVLGVATATGAVIAGGAFAVRAGWWWGVPLVLAGVLLGLLVSAWLFWRER